MSPIEVCKNAASDTTSRVSLACGLPGQFSLCFMTEHAAGAAFGLIGLHRVLNAACAPTADGVHLY
ncbi:hypothetical protein, partial [Streptococcus pneumoniae]|uniref:hypothetical protein n=1 Tax=Streptococcus pneumoniae TaxID=1313 RepID=UPI0012D777BA